VCLSLGSVTPQFTVNPLEKGVYVCACLHECPRVCVHVCVCVPVFLDNGTRDKWFVTL
jgi:hypothetical protein